MPDMHGKSTANHISVPHGKKRCKAGYKATGFLDREGRKTCAPKGEKAPSTRCPKGNSRVPAKTGRCKMTCANKDKSYKKADGYKTCTWKKGKGPSSSGGTTIVGKHKGYRISKKKKT